MENKMPTVEQMKMIIVAEESDGLAAAALLGLLAAGAGVAPAARRGQVMMDLGEHADPRYGHAAHGSLQRHA